MATIIVFSFRGQFERDYHGDACYKNLADFFPVLLDELAKKYSK